jgi:3',5'-cyclic AMP phosphodiesterase CpdA
VVPGNHDVQWWRAPLGIGRKEKLYENYSRFISSDLEPVLRIPRATFVGLNTSHGVTLRTLTWNLRDISIIGDIRREQFRKAEAAFAQSPPSDARAVVMHHNPVKGELSKRHGLKGTKKILGAFAAMGVDLILCGHDHQESVHYIEHTKKGTVISTAGTVSSRSRGGRPSSVNVIRILPGQIEVTTHIWSDTTRTFVAGPHECFER